MLRMGVVKDGPVVTDRDLWICDARFPGGIDDTKALGFAIDGPPGVLGPFLGTATDLMLGRADGIVG